ncbi:uncharacterized protein [Cicer arietinum]|uniref:uncharacterized protein n=1 Tax=Cicer arietinum TaxID=3827 RepID=UPI003CC5C015
MSKSIDLPDCYNYKPPITITPCAPTPNHSLYLSNLDDLMYQRLYFNRIYIFKKSVEVDTLKSSLSRVLVDYYPLAGRLRTSSEDENKLVVDCNGEGVLFAEASMDITAEELLIPCMTQHKSLKKLKCKGNTKKIKKLKLPKGFYGNAFVLVSAESTVKDLVNSNNLDHCIKCVQQAKSYLDDEEYIRSSIDLLKDKTLIVNESTNVFVSQLNKLGIQDLDFGEGKPFHVDTFDIDFGVLLLPVIGDPNAVRVITPFPKNLVDKYHHCMTKIESWEQDE